MSFQNAQSIANQLNDLQVGDPLYATRTVDLVLDEARRVGASDVHFQPDQDGMEVSWRVDGVLEPVARIPGAVAANVVARLKVLADLLTYHTEVPQEGRIRTRPGTVETRVSTFPTLHGERAVMRLFESSGQYLHPKDLGYPEDVIQTLTQAMAETSGLIVIAGPAGSGKTTTLYACLRSMAESRQSRVLVSLEDPIEVAVPGVAQSQVRPESGFSLELGLKSILRQDPEVIAVGEIRDVSTAELAFQGALTGHLVLTTFHAGSVVEAVGRLQDMGIEPYLLRSGLRVVLSQRLVRRVCPSCSKWSEDEAARPGLPVSRVKVAVGCPECRGTGYKGRFPLVEILALGSGEQTRSLVEYDATSALESRAQEFGMKTRWDRALIALEQGWTTAEEVRRVLGLTDPWRQETSAR